MTGRTAEIAAGPPLVSCVIIFHDAERHLAEAIDSVLAQTYPDWELILVDDGSSDRSRGIAARYASLRPQQIRIFEHPDGKNHGKSASRNLGLSAARGVYVAMLDADDAWLPHKIEEQVAILQSRPDVGMVYGPVQYWCAWTGRPRDRLRQSVSKLGVEPGTVVEPPALLIALLSNETRRAETICPFPSAVMLRKATFEQAGGFEKDFRQLYDDTIFFAKVFLQARVFVSERVWVKYRVHPDETLSASYERAIQAGEWSVEGPSGPERLFFERTAAYVAARGRTPLGVRLALWRALARYRNPILHRGFDLARSFKDPVRRMVQGTGWSKAARVGELRWGDLRRTAPLLKREGGHGKAIDRHYADAFCNLNAAEISGDVAEVGDDGRARLHAGGRTTSVRVLTPGDLLAANTHLGACDALIAIDVIQYVEHPKALIDGIHALLRPGGVALISLPGLLPRLDGAADRWRFTVEGARTLLEQTFAPALVETTPYGNAYAAVAALHGLGVLDCDAGLLSESAPDHAVVIMAKVRRARD